MGIELFKVVKEDVNYLVYFSNFRYWLFVVLLAVLTAIPILFFYSTNFDIAIGIIIGMFWLVMVRMVGFSFKKNDS